MLADNNQLPNIVLIFTDEMDPEYLEAYGGPYTTPNITRLAESGMRFNQAYTAAATCVPSRYSMLTGSIRAAVKNLDLLAKIHQIVLTWLAGIQRFIQKQ